MERVLSGLRSFVGLGERDRKRGCTGITDYTAKESYGCLVRRWNVS